MKASFDCDKRWRAKCNHVRTGGMLTTHSPMSASNTTSIVYTTSATTSPTTTGTAGPTNKGNLNNLVLTTCELQLTNVKKLANLARQYRPYSSSIFKDNTASNYYY